MGADIVFLCDLPCVPDVRGASFFWKGERPYSWLGQGTGAAEPPLFLLSSGFEQACGAQVRQQCVDRCDRDRQTGV